MAIFQDKDQKIKSAFNLIKEELSEHLDAINENTEELQNTYNFSLELESRLNALEDKINRLQIMLEQMASPPLTKHEELLFQELYTNESSPLSYADLSGKIGIPELMARKTIAGLIRKGVEIDVNLIDGKPFFRLDKEYRDRQAKQNMIKLKQLGTRD